MFSPRGVAFPALSLRPPSPAKPLNLTNLPSLAILRPVDHQPRASESLLPLPPPLLPSPGSPAARPNLLAPLRRRAPVLSPLSDPTALAAHLSLRPLLLHRANSASRASTVLSSAASIPRLLLFSPPRLNLRAPSRVEHPHAPSRRFASAHTPRSPPRPRLGPCRAASTAARGSPPPSSSAPRRRARAAAARDRLPPPPPAVPAVPLARSSTSLARRSPKTSRGFAGVVEAVPTP
ncbi:protein enabled homolog [Ananas comosus]|uniref:Protein enabled homolog n=1 Tax=Ananas comosus TaxID=4615 RepID=A0A6P5GXU9_ANACO|nr:protein enabled homolog [Ananas comosus]